MFDKLEDDYSSEAFNQFKDNRLTIAQRLQNREFTGDGIYANMYADSLGMIDDSTSFLQDLATNIKRCFCTHL